MTAIKTTLTTSGNSVAVRLPKDLLRMSGLGKDVMIEAQKGRIIISKVQNPRSDWESKIRQLASDQADPSLELQDMKVAENDGLEDIPWDGPTFEDWQKRKAKDAGIS